MKSFKISFYKSESGELVKIKELFRLADSIDELVAAPPQEFFDMLSDYFPLQGWAEMEENRANVYVIFAPRAAEGVSDIEVNDFREWLDNIKPADFKGTV